MKQMSKIIFAISFLIALKVQAQEDTLQWNSTGDSINYTSRKVGIGISNPVVPLHVKGQITTDSLRVFGRIHVGPSSLWLGQSTPFSGSDDITSTNGLISFGGEPSVTTFDNIQVTIGTQVGQQKLHISDGSSNAVRMQYTNSGTGTTTSDGFQIGILGGGSNGYAVFNQQENLPMLFNTYATERMRILGDGNVGINNTSPANKLEITHGTGGNSGLRFTNLTNSSTSITNTTDKILSVNSSGDVILVDDKQGTGSGTGTVTSGQNGLSTISGGTIIELGGNLIKNTTIASNTYNLVYTGTSSGSNASGGNFGIGNLTATTTSALLHVSAPSAGNLLKFQQLTGMHLKMP